MENHTVARLKAIAKERGIRGYYKFRMVEMINALEAVRLVEQKRNIFGDPIPNDPTPVLQPTPSRPSNITTKVKLNIKQIIKYFGEWLLNYIPPKPNVVNKVLSLLKIKLKKYERRDTLYRPTQFKSAFKTFVIQY